MILDRLEEALTMWDQAGPKPYEVLIEYGYYQDLLDELDQSKYNLKDYIYRGLCGSDYSKTLRDCKVGDSIDLTQHPTSWSLELDVAMGFIYDDTDKVILKLSSKLPLSALYNTYNSYKEYEVILNKTTLLVINVTTSEDVVVLECVLL